MFGSKAGWLPESIILAANQLVSQTAGCQTCSFPWFCWSWGKSYLLLRLLKAILMEASPVTFGSFFNLQKILSCPSLKLAWRMRPANKRKTSNLKLGFRSRL